MSSESETATAKHQIKRAYITPSALRGHAENLSPSGTYWVCEVLEKAALEIERLQGAEIERLRRGIQAMLDGNYPNPRYYRPGQCPHEIRYYETCEQCNDGWLMHVLNGGDAPDDRR